MVRGVAERRLGLPDRGRPQRDRGDPPGRFPERGRIASGCFDGTWRLDEAFLVRGDEALRARATPTQYFVLGEGFRVAFEKDAAGKIAVMVVKVPGREMRANRIE